MKKCSICKKEIKEKDRIVETDYFGKLSILHKECFLRKRSKRRWKR